MLLRKSQEKIQVQYYTVFVPPPPTNPCVDAPVQFKVFDLQPVLSKSQLYLSNVCCGLVTPLCFCPCGAYYLME